MQLILQMQKLKYTDISSNLLPLVEYPYGLAIKDEKSGEPKAYSGFRNDYHSLIPDDAMRSYSFFYESGPSRQVQGNLFEFDLSLFIWYNEKRFDRTGHALQQTFIQLLIQKLFSNARVFFGVQVFTRREQVFEYFDYKGFLLQDMPYNAFRIRFRAQAFLKCLPDYVQQKPIEC